VCKYYGPYRADIKPPLEVVVMTSLVIACCSFDKGMEKLNPHITVKKIPQMLLERCEFDKSDYNLNIIHPPVYEDEEDCDEE